MFIIYIFFFLSYFHNSLYAVSYFSVCSSEFHMSFSPVRFSSKEGDNLSVFQECLSVFKVCLSVSLVCFSGFLVCLLVFQIAIQSSMFAFQCSNLPFSAPDISFCAPGMSLCVPCMPFSIPGMISVVLICLFSVSVMWFTVPM